MTITESQYPPSIYAGIDRLFRRALAQGQSVFDRQREHIEAEKAGYITEAETQRRAAQNERLNKLRGEG